MGPAAQAHGLVGGSSIAGNLCGIGRQWGLGAARQAERIDDLEAAVKDVQQFQIQGKWPEAEAVAIRADDLLKDGHWSDLAERVHGLLADCRLVVRLEEIRLLQSDVRAKENRFAQERAVPEYRQAFKE